MKIIDLLNKIAKGEEVPKEIEYQGTRYIFDENDYKLYRGANLLTENCLTSYINAVMLNDEIEIIEEVEDKEYEEIEEITYKPRKVQNAINALIRNQKKIIERLEKGE